MAYKIGINVVEVDGVGAPAIVGAAVSVGAFNVLTRRGLPNRPIRVSSFPQFVERFGGYFPGGLGAYMVRGFFDNGGQTAYVNRIVDGNVGTGAAPASLTLDDASPADTLTLEAGFRGSEDPGSWGDALFVRVLVAVVVRRRRVLLLDRGARRTKLRNRHRRQLRPIRWLTPCPATARACSTETASSRLS